MEELQGSEEREADPQHIQIEVRCFCPKGFEASNTAPNPSLHVSVLIDHDQQTSITSYARGLWLHTDPLLLVDTTKAPLKIG